MTTLDPYVKIAIENGKLKADVERMRLAIAEMGARESALRARIYHLESATDQEVSQRTEKERARMRAAAELVSDMADALSAWMDEESGR